MNVFVRTSAREDILRQYLYYLVGRDAAATADRFLIAVEAAVETISRNPAIGAPKFFDNPKLAGIRSWPVAGFPAMRICYIQAANELRMVRVLHGRRDISSLLENEDPEDA